jgi:predicted Fe-Mo cluster-binding NifX family protein
MLVAIPMNSTDVQEAQIARVLEAKTWAQLRIEEGELVEVVHADTYDGFENWSEAVVVCDDSEPVMEFINMSMMVLVAHTQKTIDEIVEAFLFRELHDLAY